MHIHGNHMNIQGADFHSAAQSGRAAAAEHAAETRRKLLRKSAEIDAGASPEENLLIGHWLGVQQGQGEGESHSSSNSGGKDLDFG